MDFVESIREVFRESFLRDFVKNWNYFSLIVIVIMYQLVPMAKSFKILKIRMVSQWMEGEYRFCRFVDQYHYGIFP
jgi:hypothetical protein